MLELTEREKEFIIGAIPSSTPALFVAGLQGSKSTVLDRSTNNTTGTVTGVKWVRTRRGHRTLLFNGAGGYVDFGNPATLQITGELTIIALVMLPNPIVTDVYVVTKHAGAPQRGYILGIDATGKYIFQISNDGTALIKRNGSTLPAVSTLHVIAGVFVPSAKVDFYLDGDLNNGVLTGVIPAAIHNSTANFRLGTHVLSTWWKGNDIPVVVFASALSDAQIKGISLRWLTI
jgi:hypothetical protein